MEYITSRVPAVSSESEAGKITSYLRGQKNELNHVLESITTGLYAEIRRLYSALSEAAGAGFESGQTDGWYWRKYPDGTAECRGRFICSGVKCASAWGSVYISEDYGGAEFPFAFAEVPSVQYSISETDARGYLLGYPSGDGSATKESTGKWWFARGVSSSAADRVTVDVYAFGEVAR